MEKHDIDILCVQETRKNTNEVIRYKEYIIIYSTDIEEPVKKPNTGIAKGKGKLKNKEYQKPEHYEELGVAIIYKVKLEKYRLEYKQISNKLMSVKFNMHGPPLTITNVHPPQGEHKKGLEYRETWWEDLIKYTLKIKCKIYISC